MSHDNGDFEALIAPIQDRMVLSIWRVLRDADETDDVTQEVLLDVFRKMKRIRSHPNPTALVLRICVNRAIDHLRRRRGKKAALESGEHLAQLESVHPPAEEALVQEESRAAILALLAKLPKREAEAIVLLAVEELSYPDIAQAMGCRESTARVLVHKARKRLRAQLGDSRSPLQ